MPLSKPRLEDGYEFTFTVQETGFRMSVQMGITLTVRQLPTFAD
jgi:hypothetical protein